MLLPDRHEPVAYGKRAAQRRAQVEIGVCDRASAKRPSSAILVFDDDAGTPVGNNSVLSGLFNPVKAISAFNGEDPFGDWAITISMTLALIRNRSLPLQCQLQRTSRRFHCLRVCRFWLWALALLVF